MSEVLYRRIELGDGHVKYDPIPECEVRTATPVCDLCDAELMCAACGHQQRPGAAQAPTKPSSDDRPIPTYGQISWQQLGRDVMDAMYAKRTDYEFDPSYYPGHQMLPTLNFNSLARIVDKYRYYGASAVPSASRGTEA